MSEYDDDENEGLGPQANSLSDLLSNFLTSLLGLFIPGGGANMLVSAALPHIQQHFSGVPWSSTFSTNMTATGVANYNLRRSISSLGRDVADSMLMEDINENAEMLMRTLNPYDSYVKNYWGGKENEQSKAGYQRYISDKAAGIANFPMMKQIYPGLAKMLGLEDIGAATGYISRATTNMTRRALRSGDIRDAAMAYEVVGNLFTGEQQADGLYARKKFDKSDWNGMSKAEVSGLAAALTKDFDFLKDVNMSDPQQARNAVSRFREVVREYTKALAPLKDVFGSDLQKMLSTIESIGGKSIGQMGSTLVSRVSEQLAFREASGMYSINGKNGLAGFTNSVEQRLASMQGLSQINYGSVLAQSILAADVTKYRKSSDYTDAQWKALSITNVTDTANSGAADLAARNYVVWRQGKQDEAKAQRDAELRAIEEDTTLNAEEKAQRRKQAQMRYENTLSFDNFQSRVVERMRDSSVSFQQAAREVSGATVADEQAASASTHYIQAVSSGDAARLAMLGKYSKQRDILTRTLLASSAGWYGRALERVGLKREQAKEITEMTFDVLEQNWELANINDEDQLLDNIKKYQVNGKDLTDEQAKGIASTIVWSRTSNRTGRMFGEMMNSRSVIEIQANELKARERRQAIEAIVGDLPSNWTEYLKNPDSTKGFSVEAMMEKFRKSNIATSLGADDVENLLLLSSAGAQFANSVYGSGTENTAAFAKTASGLLKFGTSIDAIKSSDYRKVFEEYKASFKESREGKDEETKRIARGNMEVNAAVMAAYANVTNPAEVDRYLGAGGGDTEQDRERNRWQRKVMLSKAMEAAQKDPAANNIKDFLARNAIDDSIQGMKDEKGRERLSALWEEFKTGYNKDLNGDRRVAYNENADEFFKAKQKEIDENKSLSDEEKALRRSELDDLRGMMNVAGQGGNGSSPNDVFNMIYDVLKKLLSWLDTENGKKKSPWTNIF